MEQIPEYFIPVKGKIDSIPKPRLEHTLNFVKQQKNIDKMVLGVTRLQDLKEIEEAYAKNIPETDYRQYMITEAKYINPYLWQLRN